MTRIQTEHIALFTLSLNCIHTSFLMVMFNSLIIVLQQNNDCNKHG